MPKGKKEPEPESSAKPNALVIRGSEAWMSWLRGLAEHDRTSMAVVVDVATAEHAKKVGYKVPPPKR